MMKSTKMSIPLASVRVDHFSNKKKPKYSKLVSIFLLLGAAVTVNAASAPECVPGEYNLTNAAINKIEIEDVFRKFELKQPEPLGIKNPANVRQLLVALEMEILRETEAARNTLESLKHIDSEELKARPVTGRECFDIVKTELMEAIDDISYGFGSMQLAEQKLKKSITYLLKLQKYADPMKIQVIKVLVKKLEQMLKVVENEMIIKNKDNHKLKRWGGKKGYSRTKDRGVQGRKVYAKSLMKFSIGTIVRLKPSCMPKEIMINGEKQKPKLKHRFTDFTITQIPDGEGIVKMKDAHKVKKANNDLNALEAIPTLSVNEKHLFAK